MGARFSRINRGKKCGFLLVKVAIKSSKNIGKDLELKFFVKATPPPPRIWAHIRGALLVSQDRRHLLVTPDYYIMEI
jgi:hypothetical protein